MIILYLSGICSHCLKLFGNGVNKQEAGLVNMPKPAPKRIRILRERAYKAMSKAKHCDECRNATIKWYVYRGPPVFPVLTCAKKHNPRFYKQRNDNPLDDSYGWKRVCADFETAKIT